MIINKAQVKFIRNFTFFVGKIENRESTSDVLTDMFLKNIIKLIKHKTSDVYNIMSRMYCE